MENIIINLINNAGFNSSDELIEEIKEYYSIFGKFPPQYEIQRLYIKVSTERASFNSDIIRSVCKYASEASEVY